MSFRTLLVVAAGAGIAVAVGIAVAGLAPFPATPPQDVYRGSEPPAGIRLVDFSLRDERGRLVHARDLRGKVVVLTFLDSQCRETCPVVAGLVADGLAALPQSVRRSVAALAISTDPAGDTAASRRRFLRRHGAHGRIRYLSGSLPELERVWAGFQVLSSHESGDDEVHSAPVRIYAADGFWVATLHAGADLSPANLAHDVRTALERGAR